MVLNNNDERKVQLSSIKKTPLHRLLSYKQTIQSYLQHQNTMIYNTMKNDFGLKKVVLIADRSSLL